MDKWLEILEVVPSIRVYRGFDDKVFYAEFAGYGIDYVCGETWEECVDAVYKAICGDEYDG